MNLSPELSTTTAILTTLLAASLWGSWLVSLKYLDDYPLDAFIVTLFATSLVFVWGVGFALDGGALPGNIHEVWTNDPIRVLATIAGGAVYVNGLRFSLAVLGAIGLTLGQPIQSSISIVVGTLISALVGGVPESVSLGWIAVACVVLTGAVTVAVLAGHYRRGRHIASPDTVTNGPTIWRALALLVVASLLIPAYPLTLSFSLRSATHPEGLAVLPYMTLLATGAFIGALLSSGLSLTLHRQWGCVFTAGMQTHKFAIGSALFHYTGNIIHTFATASLSSAISWPLAMSAGLWTLMLGLAHREFKGAPPRAYAALTCSVALYITGVAIIARTLY